MIRLHSIDYLRGLMSLSILFYHLTAWSIGVPEVDTILGKLGIYGVSIFYIVSGMAMYVSYKNTRWSLTSVWSFFVRRFCRLAPVYWIAIALFVLYFYISAPDFRINWKVLITNLTLTFGVLSPHNYMVTGGWSIGNEFAFYLVFPLLIVAVRSKKTLAASMVLICAIYLYFCFFKLNTDSTLAEQWKTYVNPLNQLMLFASGVVISWSYNSDVEAKNNIKYGARAAFFALMFSFYPAEGNQINIVTGWDRVAMTAIVVALSYCILNVRLECSNMVEKALKFLGDISYPVYLLHGISFLFFDRFIWPLFDTDSGSTKLAVLLLGFTPALFCISYAVYRAIELPVIAMAKARTSMEKNKAPAQIATL